MIKKIFLTITGVLLFIPQVNAMSFKDGNNLYVLEERDITCIKDYYFIDLDKNNDLIFGKDDATSELDIIKVNENNECVEMTLQEKYDYLNEPEVYYELYGGGLHIGTDNEEYKIKEISHYLYLYGLIKTEDTEINPNKTYIEVNMQNNSTSEIENPIKEKLSTYYEKYYFTYPKSAKLDTTLTYYKKTSGLIYEKVNNPKQEDMKDYYLLAEGYINPEKTIGTVNQEKYQELLKEYGNVFVEKDKEKDNLYISVLTKILDGDEYPHMLYSVYTPEGTQVGPFKDVLSFDTYHNSLFGVTTDEGLKIYNDKYELLYTNKDIGYLAEFGYKNDTYIMESWDPVTKEGKLYEMKVYKLTSENNQVYKNKNLEVTSNRDLPKTTKITINDKELEKKYYTIENNKLILNKKYLSTLDKGTYTINLNYSDNEYLTSTFIISSSIINNPETYDGITTYIIIALLSSVIIIGSIIYLRKTKKS